MRSINRRIKVLASWGIKARPYSKNETKMGGWNGLRDIARLDLGT
jgi:hypothetical protein